jgi:hypothetical protein
MQSEMPENFRELCARAQKESNIETVGEIVDRLLRKDKTEAKQMSGSPKTGYRRTHGSPQSQYLRISNCD